MIPICLVTGFLGSGKTTLLKNLVKQYRDRKVVYLVNDFARLDVDGMLLDEAGDAVVSISGGSIFCKCLVTDFMNQLQRIHRGDAAFGAPPDGLVIEASGIADPRVFRTMLSETGQDAHYVISSIITVVDPGRFLKLIHTLPNIHHQVEAADVVLVNKQDLYDESTLQQAEEEILKIAPGARMLRTQNSDIQVDLFEPSPSRELDGDYAKCADPNYASFSLPSELLNPDDLVNAVESAKDDIYRLKGFVNVGDNVYVIDYSGGRCSARVVSNMIPAELGLACITRGGVEDLVRQQLIPLFRIPKEQA